MKIIVKRTGGYAGLSEEVVAVDTSQLDTAEAQRVEHLIQSKGFFNLPANAADDAVGADMFRYEIAVSDGARQHTVAFNEGSTGGAPLLDLVEGLKRLA
jgi:hypothetical protein